MTSSTVFNQNSPESFLASHLEWDYTISRYADVLRKGSSLNDEQKMLLAQLLEAMGKIKNLTQAFAKRLKLKENLEVMMGLRLGIEFPKYFADEATALHQKFEVCNWGQLLTPVIEGPLILTPTLRTEGHKNSGESSRTLTAQPSRRQTPRIAPPGRPIYGINGIMHHILRYQSNRKEVSRVDPNYVKKSAKVFGNNGLEIGAWFATRRCASRDGAHGTGMTGIDGTSPDGAYAVILAMHSDLDVDLGDTIYYTAPHAEDNTDPTTPTETAGARALLRSLETQNPIRVIRSSSGSSKYGPSAGSRYDGLYRVSSYDIRHNTLGGAYWRFVLLRLPDQAPVDTSRPTVQEIRDLSKIKAGY
ncbi:MAG: hypothetical protein M1834_001144 [Cirrosporium novae-zelandiae]|nr:MAG: hypothetical protein M1834_001144 [Cirrosporium novae-zelandiae]